MADDKQTNSSQGPHSADDIIFPQGPHFMRPAEHYTDSLLQTIPDDLPALEQAQRISEKAVAAGFEWNTVADVWDKVQEEVDEFLEAAPRSAHKAEEFGDVLFTLVNVARKEGIDAEKALLATCEKFRLRWATMEHLAQANLGCSIDNVSREQLEELWDQAKRQLAG